MVRRSARIRAIAEKKVHSTTKIYNGKIDPTILQAVDEALTIEYLISHIPNDELVNTMPDDYPSINIREGLRKK